MARYALTWIDRDADVGPVFRIGDKDVYSRERPGLRAVRLAARHSPNLDYVAPAVQAFTELSAQWGGPIVFIIDPDVKKPPAARFLFEWSKACWENGSVDQSYMVMQNRLTLALGRFVCRMFTAGGMPFEAVLGEDALAERLDAMDLDLPQADWTPPQTGTALTVQRELGDGLYGHLFKRLVRRVRGGAPPPAG